MRPPLRLLNQSVFTGVFALLAIVILISLVVHQQAQIVTGIESEPPVETAQEPIALVDEDPEVSTETTEEAPQLTENLAPEISQETLETPQVAHTEEVTVEIPPLYNTPGMSLDTVNTMTLPALVNILCASSQGSRVTGAVGSGVIIDPRGVILTNAHVAQYLLLQNHPTDPTRCVIRTGAPARSKYTAEVFAFPSAWMQEYGKDLLLETPEGTGENDWALLYITGRTDGSERPPTFPFIDFDTRQAVMVTGDSVLLASYPAGFLGSIVLQKELWPVSTTVVIQKVYTFTQSLIDIVSLGGNIVAQAGSSGGAVVNPWGKLVGIIVTSSFGETTAERDLRALTLSHIDSSVREHENTDLLSFLQQGNFEERVRSFKTSELPSFLEHFPL